MKTLIRISILFALLVLITTCKKDEPGGDPTDRFIDADLSMEEWIATESGDPNAYYTYFCFCNASDHIVHVELNFGDGGEIMSANIEPGYKDIDRVAHLWPYGWKLISSFEFLLNMAVFYDDPDAGRYIRPGKIWESYSDVDFTERFKSKQIRDQSQWIYEEFTPNRARWTYIFTNADYNRAKKISEERDKQNPATN